MWRKVAGVVIGYLAMAMLVIVSMIAAQWLLGRDFVLEKDSLVPSAKWCWLQLALGAISAILGGFVAAKIGRQHFVVLWLAGLCFVFGLINAAATIFVPALLLPADQVPADMTLAELTPYIKQPGWFAIILAFLGPVGILIGGLGVSGRNRNRRKQS